MSYERSCMLTFVFAYLLAYDDLFWPLKTSCPAALTAPNKAGVTPEDMLEWMKFTEVIMGSEIQSNVVLNLHPVAF